MEPRTVLRERFAEADLDQALARAVVWEALARLAGDDGAATLGRLGSREQRESLEDAACALEGASAADLVAEVRALVDAARDALPAALEEDRARLFGHTARGEAPPYETEYGRLDTFRQAQEMADLGGFYSAFGLDVDVAERERPDHIAFELEFLLFLTLKEAYELTTGRVEDLEEVRRAQRLFLKEHLGRFGRAFARSLTAHARHPLFCAFGKLLESFLASECARRGVPIGPEWIELRPEEDDDVPMACGGCSVPGGFAGCGPEGEET